MQGAELEAYLQKERAAKEKEAAQQAALVRSQRMLEADEDESDSESDSDADEEDEVRQALRGESGDADMDATAVLTKNGSPGRRKREERGLDGADWGLDGDEGLTKQLLSYDIFLKGNVSKSTSFFKTAGIQTQRFRMFPYVEKKRRVDEYGETIDVGMWLRKGKAFEELAEDDDSKDQKRRLQLEEDAKVRFSSSAWLVTNKQQKAIREPPSKFVTTTVEVQLACRLLFVDMEGLNDGRAVKTIVPQVNPRKMVLPYVISKDSLLTPFQKDHCACFTRIH